MSGRVLKVRTWRESVLQPRGGRPGQGVNCWMLLRSHFFHPKGLRLQDTDVVATKDRFPYCQPLFGEPNCGLAACCISGGFELRKTLKPWLVEGETGLPQYPGLLGKQKLKVSPSFLPSLHFCCMAATVHSVLWEHQGNLPLLCTRGWTI